MSDEASTEPTASGDPTDSRPVSRRCDGNGRQAGDDLASRDDGDDLAEFVRGVLRRSLRRRRAPPLSREDEEDLVAETLAGLVVARARGEVRSERAYLTSVAENRLSRLLKAMLTERAHLERLHADVAAFDADVWVCGTPAVRAPDAVEAKRFLARLQEGDLRHGRLDWFATVFVEHEYCGTSLVEAVRPFARDPDNTKRERVHYYREVARVFEPFRAAARRFVTLLGVWLLTGSRRAMAACSGPAATSCVVLFVLLHWVPWLQLPLDVRSEWSTEDAAHALSSWATARSAAPTLVTELPVREAPPSPRPMLAPRPVVAPARAGRRIAGPPLAEAGDRLVAGPEGRLDAALQVSDVAPGRTLGPPYPSAAPRRSDEPQDNVERRRPYVLYDQAVEAWRAGRLREAGAALDTFLVALRDQGDVWDTPLWVRVQVAHDARDGEALARWGPVALTRAQLSAHWSEMARWMLEQQAVGACAVDLTALAHANRADLRRYRRACGDAP
ncbi:MAG TPA: hypothetical protein PKA64_06925 [Myxococcota bacterium]|nr:hypothetical protein [Myxococcota bacterium]